VTRKKERAEILTSVEISTRMSDKRELLVELKSGKSRPVVAGTPVLSSARSPWQGLLLEQHELVPFESNDVCCLNNLIFLHQAEAMTLEWKQGGQYRSIPILPNQISVLPAQLGYSARSTHAGGHFLMLSLEPRILAYAAYEFADPNRLELALTLGANDSFIQAMCLALHAEAQAGAPGGRLYSDSLGTALAVHLVQKYSLQAPRTREYNGGLAKYQLRRAVDFIHENLDKDVSLNALASAVGISPYHFARLFKQSTGLAPHQYLLRCRVERARHLFLSSEASIADIAVRLGFCDQSHLASHFKRVYGVTPKKFQREMISRKIEA
jgi:AraC family transcriptional regulator